MKVLKKILCALLIVHYVHITYAQQDFYEGLLREEVKVENPVYMPVIGIGPGVVNYYGELSNQTNGYLAGNKAMKINISTFLDQKHFFTGNFFVLVLGKFSGEKYSPDYPQNYMNFSSQFNTLGINVQYKFEHLIHPRKPIHPYLSFGVELLQFASKTDMLNSREEVYHYNPDGTLRNEAGDIITRDYEYETNLREELDYGLGKYAENALAFPIEVGVSLFVSDRSYLELGTSLHYTLTDLIDHISHKNTKGIIGNKGNDVFTFTSLSFHIDMFSSPEAITVKKLFADLDFDRTMYGDEDNDRVLDRADNCVGTPEGVEVDSVGCPLDSDGDNIPDYIDKQPNTPKGAFVNEEGEELTREEIAEIMNAENAIKREMIDEIMDRNLNISHFNYKMIGDLPEKYKKVDRDNDGYISYNEVLQTIDDFFNNKTDFNTSDIYKLKEIFFSQ
jgi:hypothetical protein